MENNTYLEILKRIDDARIFGGLAALIAFFWFLCKLPVKAGEPAKEPAKA